MGVKEEEGQFDDAEEGETCEPLKLHPLSVTIAVIFAKPSEPDGSTHTPHEAPDL